MSNSGEGQVIAAMLKFWAACVWTKLCLNWKRYHGYRDIGDGGKVSCHTLEILWQYQTTSIYTIIAISLWSIYMCM